MFVVAKRIGITLCAGLLSSAWVPLLARHLGFDHLTGAAMVAAWTAFFILLPLYSGSSRLPRTDPLSDPQHHTPEEIVDEAIQNDRDRAWKRW
jgi:hypothetical protein